MAAAPNQTLVGSLGPHSAKSATELRKLGLESLSVPNLLAHSGADSGWALPDLNQRSIGYEPIALTRLS